MVKTHVALLLAGVCLACASSASAVVPSGNLLENPGAEADVGSTDAGSGGDVDVTGFTAVQYGTGGFPSDAFSASIGGGGNFFSGGAAALSSGQQTIDLSADAAAIDIGTVDAELSGFVGGFEDQEDNARVEATFLAADGTPTSGITLGPVFAADRDSRPS